MKDKVIEPSEIIIEQEYVKTKPTRVNPWIRFIARFVDYSLFFQILLMLRKLFHGHLPGLLLYLLLFHYLRQIDRHVVSFEIQFIEILRVRRRGLFTGTVK